MADMSDIFKMFSDKMSSDPESIKKILSSFQGNNSESPYGSDGTSMPDMETILKIKKIMEGMNSPANDPRSNLLLSLKPYLRDSKKSKVEQYVKMLNLTKLISLFNENEGDKK